MKVPDHIQKIQDRRAPPGAPVIAPPKQQKPPPKAPLDPRTPMEKMDDDEDAGYC